MRNKKKASLFFYLALFLAGIFSSPLLAVESVEQVKEAYQAEKENYQQIREDYLKSRTEITKWRRFSEEKKEERLEIAKEFVIRGIKLAFGYLNRWQREIELMAGDQSVKDQAETEFLVITAFLSQKEAELNQAVTVGQVRIISQEIRLYWQDKKRLTKKFTGLALATHVEAVIVSAETVLARLESAVTTVEQSGKDISNGKKLFSGLEEKIILAKEKLDQAKEEFNAIDSAEKADILFIDGIGFLKESRGFLGSFRNTAKQLWKEINN